MYVQRMYISFLTLLKDMSDAGTAHVQCMPDTRLMHMSDAYLAYVDHISNTGLPHGRGVWDVHALMHVWRMTNSCLAHVCLRMSVYTMFALCVGIDTAGSRHSPSSITFVV